MIAAPYRTAWKLTAKAALKYRHPIDDFREWQEHNEPAGQR
jgi:hypothetical protein